MNNAKSKKIIYGILCVIVTIVLTIIIFNARQNYLYVNRYRLFIFAYQTNISGSDGEEWAKKLKNKFTDVPDFEVSAFVTKEAGNESITITSENGWKQVVIRLAAGQGDILFVNNEIFYNVLLEQNMLLPIENDFENPIKDKNGIVYGVDITNVAPDGLLNLGTSEYVGKGQPLPIISLDEKNFEIDGVSYNPRVIAVIYKGSNYVDHAQNVLYELFGEKR